MRIKKKEIAEQFLRAKKWISVKLNMQIFSMQSARIHVTETLSENT